MKEIKMKFKKLNSKGFSHEVLIVFFIVAFAIGGVAYLVASHASPASSNTSPPQTATVQIDAGYFHNGYQGNSYVHLFAYGENTNNAWCNNHRLANSVTIAGTDLGNVRKLNCTPGNYVFWLVTSGGVCTTNPSNPKTQRTFYGRAKRDNSGHNGPALHSGGNGTIYLCSTRQYQPQSIY